ncbi:MAG TPA: glycosyltransferase family 1 protein [Candidatus Saccharimonadales bacterium]|nr:glycosyltransferase family 1 protein [Candidatus Saccharimonadales bacterium]
MINSGLLIGIDASRAVKANPTGTEYYSREIIRAILELDRRNQYRLYAHKMPDSSFGEYSNVEWKIIPPGRLWSQLKLAAELKKSSPDVLFVPAHVVPLLSNVPTVVTIHGLEFLYAPQNYGHRERAYLKFSTASSISKARQVIAPSHWTKQDILKHYHCPAGKITVIAEAYNKELYNTNGEAGERPIKEPYIFSLSRLEERKNQALLVEAFALLRKEKGDVKLVLGGKPGYGFEKIRAKIDALPATIRDSVLLPGYLSETDAANYLRHAAVFAYPSKYEGFGIPMLEAFGSGTPVVASNASCLPEVAGEAAVLLPPDNALSWAAAFSRILHQPKYAEELKAKGLKRASEFSWASAAEATLIVIENAAA